MPNVPAVIGIPQHDLAEVSRLPDELRWDLFDRIEALRDAAQSDNPRQALAAVAAANAHRRGWSAKRLEAQYYALRRGDGWRALVNRAKLPGDGKRQHLTDAVIEAWHAKCAVHKRCYRSAYIEIAADYRAGRKVGDVDWRRVWQESDDLRLTPMPQRCPPGMPLPRGWSYHNFLRFKPRKVEELATRIGRRAAKELARPVRTTRALLAPGQQYVFDDLWHDCLVMLPGQPQLVRPLELACLDVASGHKAAFGLRPSRSEDGRARQNIRERDMRFLLAHVLCNIGFHREGVQLFVEHGTAAIQQSLELKLGELARRDDGTPLITVARPGVDRRPAHLAQWGAAGGGNFRSKASLESSHNLAHNRLDHLPAQVGSNSRLNAPEELEAIEAVSTKMLLASAAMPADLARRLAFPALDWETFRAALDEAYAQISSTHEHALEGWTTPEHYERQWRCHLADVWHSEADWHALTDEQRKALAPLVAQEGMTQVARKSRLQVWQSGSSDLVRLPDYAISIICGDDLAEKRPCPANGEVIFVDKGLSLAPMVFRLQSCIGPTGERVALQEGRVYGWLVNPFDTRAVFVMDVGGAYVGKCERVEVVDRRDIEAVHREMGKAEKDFQAALAPLARRGAKLAKARMEAYQRNTALLTAASAEASATDAAEAAMTAERRAAVRGLGLDDLTEATADGDGGATGGTVPQGMDALL